MSYDSTQDTLTHIRNVQLYLLAFASKLTRRGVYHDQSKLLDPEKSAFDRMTPRLRKLTYGSEEYKAALEELGEALNLHYSFNSHHPEHYPDGVNGMSLLDVVEMLCDWQAATKRHADGDILKSIEINAERFGLSDQLKRIFITTVEHLGWDKDE